MFLCYLGAETSQKPKYKYRDDLVGYPLINIWDSLRAGLSAKLDALDHGISTDVPYSHEKKDLSVDIRRSKSKKLL